MNRKDGNMDRRKGTQMGNDSLADTDLLLNTEDRVLFRTIGEFIRAEADIEEVKNDPLFNQVNEFMRKMMTNNDTDAGKSKTNLRYITESLTDNIEDKRIAEEIRDVKRESSKSGIDNVASEWVKDWNKESEIGIAETGKRRENRDFIKRSLENKVISREPKKIFYLRWILTSAAALLGAVIIIRTLLPAGDQDRIFAKYYEPFNVISSVTRGANAIVTNSYALAVESYKAHNYQEAAAGFSIAAEQESQAGPVRFFLGLSQIATENYGEAIAALESVVTGQGEYVKDANWYLGLAYIKTGEPGKARISFETLSRTPGFYHDRSAEILRRLK
jgi:TolA-binding protein